MNVYDEIKNMFLSGTGEKEHHYVDGDRFIQLLDEWDKSIPETDTGAMLEQIKRKARGQREGRTAKTRLITKIAVAAVVLLFAGTVFLLTGPMNRGPVPKASPAVCTFVAGDALFKRNNEKKELSPGIVVHAGDIITTGSGSVVEFEVAGHMRMRIRENSRILLNAMHVNSDGNLDMRGDLNRGQVMLSLKKLSKNDSAYIQTPTSVAGVRGTTFSVSVDPQKNVTVKVLEGKVRLSPRANDEGKLDDLASVDITDAQICRVDPEKKITLIPVEDTSAEVFKELSSFKKEKIKRSEASRARELTISTRPEYGKIYVDGAYMGNGRVSMFISSETHIVQVKAPGYQNKQFEVPEGKKNITRDMTLEKQAASSLSLSSWRASTTASYFKAIPGSRDTVAIGEDGSVSRISAEGVTWQRKFGTSITTIPVISGNKLIIGTADEYIHGVAVSNGSILWTIKTEGVIYPGSSPLISNGKLFAATTRGHVYCFSIKGSKEWQISIEGGVYSTPVKKENMLFVVSQEGILYGIDVQLELIVLKKEVGRVFGGAIATKKPEIVIAGFDGKVIKYNYREDEIKWTFNTGGHILLDIVSDGNSFFVCDTRGIVYRISDSGSLIWKSDLDNTVEQNPVIEGNDLVVITDTVLYRLSAENGTIQWSYVLPSPASSNLAISQTHMYIGTTEKGIIRVRK